MKMLREKIYYKSLLLQMRLKMVSIIAVGALTLASCNDAQQERTEDNIDSMAANVEGRVDNMQDNMQEKRDENFVQNVAEMNAEELHMLDLGITKGTHAEVKAAAKKMKADHEKMGQQLTDYASRKNIAMNSPELDHDMEDDKAGTDWDKDWADHMVDAHEKLVRKFERVADDTDDPELRTWANDQLPTLRDHLASAQALKDKLKK